MENDNYFENPSMANLEVIPIKRKSRAISSFLKKTYEILEVYRPLTPGL